MSDSFNAKASISINMQIDRVWDALVDPKEIKKYMFGTEVITNWKEGSSILWKGMWEGKPYEDKGIIIKNIPKRMLKYTHFSPLEGVPDLPENYYTLTYELMEKGSLTIVTLSQSNNKSKEEQEHSRRMWETMLNELKRVVEK